MQSVSVIVPTFNNSNKLSRLLHSFDILEENLPREVIVVDDGSTDETSTIVEKWAKESHDFDARYLSTFHNGGPARARNMGTMIARGECVAYTDSDCVADRYWMKELLQPLNINKGIVGVGGRVLPIGEGLISKFNSFHKVLEPPNSLLYLVTANCCYYRQAVIDANGFDEDIRKPGGEDVALSIKLRKKGWQFAYSPKAIVYHEYRESLRDFYRTYYNYGAGCAVVSSRYLRLR